MRGKWEQLRCTRQQERLAVLPAEPVRHVVTVTWAARSVVEHLTRNQSLVSPKTSSRP